MIELWVPPSTITIYSSIFEYCRAASKFELERLVRNGTAIMNHASQVLEDHQHVVAAAIILGVPLIQVYLDE